MTKTIFNTYVEITTLAELHYLIKLCLDNDLKSNCGTYLHRIRKLEKKYESKLSELFEKNTFVFSLDSITLYSDSNKVYFDEWVELFENSNKK